MNRTLTMMGTTHDDHNLFPGLRYSPGVPLDHQVTGGFVFAGAHALVVWWGVERKVANYE